ncbi:MAG: CehA/McbA family metallohydrolase [Chloroflexi bacterium]|nr:CehA/McbA family metallohydrolase [Chloroflexota bacterium]
MAFYEYLGNMHMHTPYSDGEASHREIASAAQLAGLDFVIVTDHNIWVKGVEGYYGDDGSGYVLLLVGEEIHDRTRHPQVNHCLVYGANQEMSHYASDPQALVDAVGEQGGLSFLAHPFDRKIVWQPESETIPWVDWQVQRFTGLEIWNYMSCFKDILVTPWKTLRRVFEPEKAVIGPRKDTLAKWDELLTDGHYVVGIGNADAHGTRYRIGLLRHTILPYDYLFNCVNTHILTRAPFSGNATEDAALIYGALRHGNAFISYGMVGSARGFRFTAQGDSGASAIMGETIRMGSGVTLQVIVAQRAHIKLIHQGEIIAEEMNVENLTHVTSQPGAYRVEVWRAYEGIERCWILSNPIYLETLFS